MQNITFVLYSKMRCNTQTPVIFFLALFLREIDIPDVTLLSCMSLFGGDSFEFARSIFFQHLEKKKAKERYFKIKLSNPTRASEVFAAIFSLLGSIGSHQVKTGDTASNVMTFDLRNKYRTTYQILQHLPEKQMGESFALLNKDFSEETNFAGQSTTTGNVEMQLELLQRKDICWALPGFI